jgi:hypothetical protein
MGSDRGVHEECRKISDECWESQKKGRIHGDHRMLLPKVAKLESFAFVQPE